MSQLTLNPELLDLLVELAIQSEHGNEVEAMTGTLEQQEQAAIAKCHRRIAAAQSVYLDSDMTREDYLKIKEQNEPQIVHWQARTTETEKAALELRMCMQVINQMVELWDGSNDGDRQQMAHMLFECVVYDLEQRHIVDFRLKPWADRYLVPRTDLDGNNDSSQGKKKTDHLSRSPPICAP
jgi:hypothetical protein